jgi:hypothetical protein
MRVSRQRLLGTSSRSSCQTSSTGARLPLALTVLVILVLVCSLPFAESMNSGSEQPNGGSVSTPSLAPRDPDGYANSTVRIPSPIGIATNPDTGYVYVAGGCNGPCTSLPYNSTSPTSAVYVVNPASSLIVEKVLIPGPYTADQVAVDPIRNTIWVVSSFGTLGAEYDVINGSSYRVVHTGITTDGPASYSYIAVNPDTDLVYVVSPNTYNNSVTVINAVTYKQSYITIQSPGFWEMGSIAVDAFTDMVYFVATIPGSVSEELFFANGSTNVITKEVSIPSQNVGGIAVDSALDRVLVTVGNSVDVFDGSSGKLLATVPITEASSSSSSPAPSEYGGYVAVIDNGQINDIYVTSYPQGCSSNCPFEYLNVINGNTFTQTASIELGTGGAAADGPSNVAADPNSNTVYAECCGSDMLAFTASGGGGTSMLSVSAQNTDGQPLTGYEAVLNQSGTKIVARGYTPATFTLNNGQPYTVDVDNFTTCHFAYWLDTGNTTQVRSISITSNAQITAVMNCASVSTSSSSGTTSSSTSVTSSSSSSSSGLANSSSSTTNSTASSADSTAHISSSTVTASASSSSSSSNGGSGNNNSPPLYLFAAIGVVAAVIFVVGTTITFWRRRR